MLKTIAKPVTHLFDRYKAYHEHGPLLLRYIAVLGLIMLPAMYLLRFSRPDGAYDDLWLRAVDVALLLGLLARPHWPERMKDGYLAYSYLVITVCLPVTFVFTSLMNGGGAGAVANTFMAVFFVLQLADWRNMVVMLAAGFAGGWLLYNGLAPAPRLPPEYIARLPLLVGTVIGGSLFKYALEQATAQRVRHAYASLAGSIAHEMRNPMAQVRHSLEHIRQSLPMPSRSTAQHLVDARTIDQLFKHVAQGELAVKRGLQVIAMTLDEVNAKPLDPDRLAHLYAGEVCARAIEDYGYENEHQRACVSLEIRKDFVFRGEETAYLFVLFNLLKNSLYYLPVRPAMQVMVIVDAGRIVVRDTGPGIPAEVVSRLFKPFRTVGKSAGTGLGLAYCDRIMKSLGGAIACVSEPDLFTEFVMTFPAVSDQEVEAQYLTAMAEARRVFANRRVLLADDDAPLRAATRHKLLALNCLVREACDGAEALRQLQESAFDLVVLDLNMPAIDGYELANMLRSGAVPLNRDVCLVAHSSEPPAVARVKAESSGFNGFVPKPSDTLAFVRTLCAAAEAQARSHGRTKGWLTGRRFLLADDNAYNRTAVGGYLKHAGADVIEVPNGHAVLRELESVELFDAVLLDIHMPGLGGIETARAVRAAETAQSSVPLLAITAHADAELQAQGRLAGIGDFITKPVDAALLYEKLAMLIDVQPPGLRPTAEPAEPPPAGMLLDENRLRGYQRIGMLEELTEEFVPEIESLVGRLETAVQAASLDETLEVLHSLVGMSGEAGAQALYRFARETYVPMLERQAWPASPAWLPRLHELAAQTNKALRDWTAAQRSRV